MLCFYPSIKETVVAYSMCFSCEYSSSLKALLYFRVSQLTVLYDFSMFPKTKYSLRVARFSIPTKSCCETVCLFTCAGPRAATNISAQ